MSSNKILHNGCFYCPINSLPDEPFFSLVDYRNNYFTSDDPDKIIEFYDGFENSKQLIGWMKERPKGVSKIHEVEGDKDIIVVIPTENFNGKYAKECYESIFKGLHIIFVESGKDFYFNYAHNCNVGIRRAMDYNPKWIIISNDDMYKIDDPEVLITEICNFDPVKYDIIFPFPDDYHTIPFYISKKRVTYNIYRYIRERQVNIFFNKFGVDYFYSFYKISSRFVFKKVKGTDSISTIAFGILSSKYIERLGVNIFDEIYINEHEDIDLSLRLTLLHARIVNINYKIKALRGSTIGNEKCRGLRSITGRVYFNFKYRKLFLKMLDQ